MNKRVLTVLGLGASLLLIGAGCGKQEASQPAQSAILAPTTTQPVVVPATSTPAATVKAKPVAVKAKASASVSYLEALANYRSSGYYFQFADCRSFSPNSLVIKAGVKFMLDNRDLRTHVLEFSGQRYSIASYGFTVASAPAKAGLANITCDGVNAANLNVQK